jgi:hypothetical protein
MCKKAVSKTLSSDVDDPQEKAFQDGDCREACPSG